ncbi:hypothetical protein [Beijerinckia mobilis]|uniref:hypothetical protein n=1 Tax=Beijerinckia mobilis TaxID=231434 RepID=UPI00055188B5|nr:hypothetical protein [Beijerinckia mobilis]
MNPVLGAATMIRGSLSRKNLKKSSEAAWNFSYFWLFQKLVPKPCHLDEDQVAWRKRAYIHAIV